MNSPAASATPVPADLLVGEYTSVPIPAELRPYVLEINAYAERFTRSLRGQRLRRNECSGARVVVIFEFGPPLRLLALHGHETRCYARGFVVGPGGNFAVTEHSGCQSGIQINLTLPGAALLFGVPLSEYFGRALPLAFEELLPAERDLPERLFHAGDNQMSRSAKPGSRTNARFALLLDWLRGRLAAGLPLLTQPGFHAVQAALESHGRMNVHELADQLGYSRKHLTSLFRRFAGAAPGTILRLRRFASLLDMLRSRSGSDFIAKPPSAVQIALDCGYYDQSHCIREVRAWSGVTPSALPELLATRLIG